MRLYSFFISRCVLFVFAGFSFAHLLIMSWPIKTVSWLLITLFLDHITDCSELQLSLPTAFRTSTLTQTLCWVSGPLNPIAWCPEGISNTACSETSPSSSFKTFLFWCSLCSSSLSYTRNMTLDSPFHLTLIPKLHSTSYKKFKYMSVHHASLIKSLVIE